MSLQPLIDVFDILTGSGWIELPDDYGATLWGMSKGAFKYLKRVPKPGGGYRYFYHVGHGGGIHSEDHFVPGAAFRFEGGHYHIKSAEGGKLVIEHDETKERKTVSKPELRAMLGAHHEKAIKAHREKVAGMLAEARANKASPKQIAKLEARAKAAGVVEQARPPAIPKSLKWTKRQKSENPSKVGDTHKTLDGAYVVVTEVTPTRFASASQNADFGTGRDYATWTHESRVRPADPDEIAHYDATTGGTHSMFVQSPRATQAQPETKAAPEPAPITSLPTAMRGPTPDHHAAAKQRGLSIDYTPGNTFVHMDGRTRAVEPAIRSALGFFDRAKGQWKLPLAKLNSVLLS